MNLASPPRRRAISLLAFACLAATSAGTVQAGLHGDRPRTHPDEARPARPLPPGVVVPAWTQLDPDQQRAFAEFEDRWDRMPASRRVKLLERYERWLRMPPERRAQLRDGERNFRDLSPEQRDRMRRSFQAMRALPPEERQQLRARWRGMSPEQRRAWLERGGPGIAAPP